MGKHYADEEEMLIPPKAIIGLGRKFYQQPTILEFNPTVIKTRPITARDIAARSVVEEPKPSDPIDPDHYIDADYDYAEKYYEAVVDPEHYVDGNGQCIDLTRCFDFRAGSVIKYLWRAGRKGDFVEDIRKAIWYLSDLAHAYQTDSRPSEIDDADLVRLTRPYREDGSLPGEREMTIRWSVDVFRSGNFGEYDDLIAHLNEVVKRGKWRGND